MPDEIRDYFGDGSDWNVNILLRRGRASEDGRLRKMAEQQLDLEGERLLIISGDALTDADTEHSGRVSRGEAPRPPWSSRASRTPWISASS